MANNHASLTLMLGANIRQFQTAMRQASNDLKKVGKQMKDVGKSMSMYVTAPLLAMGAASVMSFDKQAKAIAQVEAGLRSTGGTAGFTSKELQKMASELQNISLFGDEEILQGVTSQLLTFTNITNEQFARTQVAAMDLATRLDGDLKSASIQLGKALNDPIANLSALSRSGIQFSKEQKAMIDTLVETNRLADAQTIILDELERQYGGSAKAAAEAGAGPLTQLKNIIGDLGEQFGEIIMEYLKPFVAKLKEWTIAFQDLSPATKKMIVLISGLAAVAGPLLIIFGQMAIAVGALAALKFPSLIAIFAKVKIAALSMWGAITSPVAIVIGAIAAVGAAFVYVYGNFQAFKDRLGDWSWLKNAAIDALIAIIKVTSFFFNQIAKLFGIDFVAPITNALENLKSPITKSKTEFEGFGKTVKKVFNEAKNALGFGSKSITEDLKGVETQSAITSNTFVDSLEAIDAKAKETTTSLKTMREALNLKDPEEIGSKKPTIKKPILPMQYYWPPVLKGMDEFKANYVARWGQIVDTLNQITNASIAGFGVSIGEAIGNLLSGQKINFGATVLESVGNFLKEMGKALIIYAGLMEAFKSTFTNPFVAIAVGIAAVAAGTILTNLAKAGPQKMAEGGIVPPGFPNDTYPALLSSNEKVIPAAIPLPNMDSKLQEITVRLIGKLSGSDILLSSERATINRNRVRGY